MRRFQRISFLIFAGILLLPLTNCGYNRIQEADENVKASWAQVLNVYKRRSDLIPNLVNVVKGYAAHEKETLTAITEARAKASSIMATPETLNDPQALKNFQTAQAQMSSALSRLLVVVEKYPNLKADRVFIDLQSQLEGTENRISVERKRFIDAVKEYNVLIRKFPVNLTAMAFGYQVKPSFEVEDVKSLEKPPEVKL